MVSPELTLTESHCQSIVSASFHEHNVLVAQRNELNSTPNVISVRTVSKSALYTHPVDAKMLSGSHSMGPQFANASWRELLTLSRPPVTVSPIKLLTTSTPSKT